MHTLDNISTAKIIDPAFNSVQHLTEEDYLSYAKEKKQQSKHEEFAFIASDPKMLRIKEIIEQIADANVPVLITGESGTGKEVVARAIHEKSKRRHKNFVAINCAAVPVTLLESELFGYEKGAFTGAYQRHLGKFEQADGSTLLLDEVTEIESSLQAKLLRVLQEKEIERIGGSGPIKVDVRIIATTNKDIKSIVNHGNFRQDLYYRLYVIHLEIPPLRERVKDIESIAKYFLHQFAMQFNKSDIEFSQEAIQKLLKYSWPGNVRELQNVIQRAILMSQNKIIMPDDIDLQCSAYKQNLDWVKHLPIGKSLHEVEIHFILETLKYHNGNRTHAAKTLNISLRTLRNKINEFAVLGYDIPAPTSGIGKHYE